MGHEVWFAHPRIGNGVEGATNIDIPLHTDLVPVHEYLPQAGDDQRVVSEMDADEALAYVPDYVSALEEVAGEMDVLVGHHANLSAIAVHEVANRHGKPFYLFLHGTGIEPRHHGGYAVEVWDRIEAAIHAASGVIVTTDYVRDSLIQPLVDIDQDLFLVLPCGVEPEEFTFEAPDEARRRYGLPERFVICPGALTHAKGPQNVVASAEAFTDVAPVVFIGDGYLRDELEEELGDRGRFLGFVSDEDKAALISAATVLAAAPEKLEHFGIIYVEALAAGTVPVAYRGGGVDSIVSPDVGVLTERTPSALGRAIREVLEDEERANDMAAAGMRLARIRYAASELGKRLAEWIDPNGSTPGHADPDTAVHPD